VTQCIIPAAGMSSRFSGLGDLYQKFLLPYHTKPIIIHNLEILSKIEKIKLITIVLNSEDNQSEEFILSNMKENSKIKNVEFKYYDNKKYGNGPLSTILFGIEENFDSYLVILSDIILPEEFDISDEDLSFISTSSVEDPSRWCISLKKDKHIEFIDKPSKVNIEKVMKNQGSKNNLVTEIVDEVIEGGVEIQMYTALTGIYYFDDGKNLNSSAQVIKKSDLKLHKEETEISKLLKVYVAMKQNRIEFNERLIPIKDCGTIEEFIQLNAGANKREFNEIRETENGTIEKSCRDKKYSHKIIDEINWYINKPKYLDDYIPRILSYDFEVPKYETEKIRDTKLSDILLYFNRDLLFWKSIGKTLLEYFQAVEKLSPKYKSKLKENIELEVIERFSDLDQATKQQFSLEKVLKIYRSIRFFENDEFYHGDLNLSNIFFSCEFKSVKFIDPKGGQIGNTIYDLAKITQCLVFGYDFIKSNLYFKSGDIVYLYDKGIEEISRQWIQQMIEEYGREIAVDCIKLTGILFLKMVPLHSDNSEHQEIFKNLGIDILQMFTNKKRKKQIAKLPILSKFNKTNANFGSKLFINYNNFDSLNLEF
jgi:dTDP-glucose pyrophosphorylase